MNSKPTAFSYIRFSHPDQAKGDSLRRQTEAAAEWCHRNKVKLDTATTFRDLGRSAYTGTHRQNPDRNALAAFVRLVEAGEVQRGSYLIIENLDRLSREHIQPALLLALNLLQAGIRIVQLKPSEMTFDDKSDTMPVMMMMMELSRGHGESAIKSERVGKAWAAKKDRARKNGELLTRRLPAWIEAHNGKLRPIPAKAAAVKRIYRLAANGYGLTAIVKQLTKEKVPPLGRTSVWVKSYVAKILADRRAVGECQPRRRRKAEGPPIAGYFPAVVTDADWHAARAAAAQRRLKPGRVSEHHLNVFSGLLYDARTQTRYLCTNKADHRKNGKAPKNLLLISRAAMEGRGKCVSFPFATFERAVLSMLAEVDPTEVLGHDDKPKEVLVLSGELAQVEAKIAELEAELLEGDVAAVTKVLRQLETQKGELSAKLKAAQREAAQPVSEAWDEAQSLLTVLDKAPDPIDCRLRLRAALRRIVSEVWILVVPRGAVRLAAVQVRFADGKHRRDYFIYHRAAFASATARRPSEWWARSLADVAKLGEIDLRKQEHTKRMEKALAALPLEAVAEL